VDPDDVAPRPTRCCRAPVVNRRNRPFRKRPPSRRPGQLRRRPAVWEPVPWEPGTAFDQAGPGAVREELDEDGLGDGEARVGPRPLHRREPGPGYRVLVAGVVGIAVAAMAILLLVLRLGPGDDSAVTAAFHPPEPVAADGEYVRSELLPSGDLHVDHWIRSQVPLSGLTLTIPSVPAVDAGALSARRVALQAGGRTVDVAAILAGGRETISFADTDEVHLSYVLVGASRRTGSDGQTLVKLTSLRVGYAPALGTRTVAFTGARVIALACSSATATAAPCGRVSTGSADTWTVHLRDARRADRVAALVDLP
jgi:hypothetical protein